MRYDNAKSLLAALLLSFAVLAMSVQNVQAAWGYSDACYPSQTAAVAAISKLPPFVDNGFQYSYWWSAWDAANAYTLNVAYYTTNLSTGAKSSASGTVLFLGCDLHTNPAQTTLGSQSSTCVSSGACTNSDVVQSNLITQDALIYGIAVLLFFFGFHVGNGIMLGSINRG